MEWVEGSAREFDAARTCALNEAFAKMIFGEESAVGKILENGSGESRRIIGVFRNTPRNFSAHIGMLLTMGDTDRENFNEWSYNAYLTYRPMKSARPNTAADSGFPKSTRLTLKGM